jgi:ABC-type lipoprotein release transport system permease subunit
MLTILRFSLQDMIHHYKPWLAMIALITIINLVFLGLGGYRYAIKQEFGFLPYDDLIVQQSDTVGEFYGSRLSPQVAEQLRTLGVTRIIPEIHEYTGTSIADIIILRGIDLEHYQQVNSFKILSGQALTAGEPPRTAMLGWRLADLLDVQPGQEVSLRGRQFVVKGTFQTGTYVDNEAWISLDDAQKLLGYGRDVSIYIIPDEGILKAGDTLPGGISVVERGLGPRNTSQDFEPLLRIIEIIHNTLGIAVLLTLTNLLLRTAWIRRREMAILRCVGFYTHTLAFYLLSQALVLAWSGVILGLLGTVILFSFMKTDIIGMSLHPVLTLQTGLASLGQSTGIAILGTALPAWWFSRMNLASQLRSE